MTFPDPRAAALVGVMPGLFQPLQALLSFLPQILVAVAVLATAIFRPQTYRFVWEGVKANRRRVFPALAVCAVFAAGWIARGWDRDLPPAPPPLLPGDPPKAGPGGPGAGWPTFRMDRARTGSDGLPVPETIRQVWAYREPILRAGFCASPAVSEGRVYTGCENGRLYCLDTASGRLRWTSRARYEVFSSPAVADGKVFFGEGLHHHTDASLYCVNAENGKRVWDFRTTSHVEDTPTVEGGRVYFGAGDDGVYCVDEETGTKIWQSKGMHVDASPLLLRDRMIVGAGYGETGVAAIRTSDGVRLWFTKLPASAWGPAAEGPRGVIIGIGNGNFEQTLPDPKAEIVCVDPADGRFVWRTPIRDAVLAAAAVSGDRVFLGNRGGEFCCFDARDGRKLWTGGCGKAVLSSAAVTPNAIVFGCDGGHVHAVRPEDGTPLWTYDASKDGFNTDARFLASPAVVAGRVYIGCNNFFFYALGE